MNTFSLIAPNLAAILLMLLGGAGMLFPKSIASFVGIQPIAAIGISEIRATLGSFFLMLGATCLWLQSTDAFTVVGVASLAAALVRLLSSFIDKSASVKNIGGVISEALLGVLFLLSWGLS